MENNEMTNEQLNKILEMVKTIAKKCDTIEEVIKEIENIQETH